MLNCSRTEDPTLLNLSNGDTTTTTDKKILTALHMVTWYEYYLEQAVDLYGVATIVANTYHRYLAKKH